jgi:outer membrane protein assembly factor BamD
MLILIFIKNFIQKAPFILNHFTKLTQEAKRQKKRCLCIPIPFSQNHPIIILIKPVPMMPFRAIQNFINRYPNSQYVGRANDIIDQLQRKLEEKAYENAKLYYKINKSAINAADMYKAAIRSFDNFQRDFPDSQLNEEIIYLKIEAQYSLAKQSFKNLQKERYAAVVDSYQNFIDNYPTSKFLKDAESMYTNSLAQIIELQSSTK